MDTRKVVLLYPEYPDTYWGFREALNYQDEWWWTRVGRGVVSLLSGKPWPKRRKKAAFPPLGLLTVGALLPEDWEVSLHDENVRGAILEEDLKGVDILMTGGMTIQRSAMLRALRLGRACDVMTVAAGPLPTTEPEAFEELADFLVLGEFEITLPLFLSALEAGETDGICAPKHLEFADLSHSPLPLWDLVDSDDYVSYEIQFSKGCPNDCDFCNVCTLNGLKVRRKSVAQVLAELEVIREHASHRKRCGKIAVFIVDDNLTINARAAKVLLDALAEYQRKHSYPFIFFTQGDMRSAQYAKWLQDAGFSQLFLGFETPEAASLTGVGKHLNVRNDPFEVVRTLLSHGIEPQGGFIYGFDQDTEKTSEKMVKFIRRLPVMTAMVGLLEALPGTKLTKRLAEEGRVTGPSTGDNTRGRSNIEPKDMSREDLAKGFRYIVTTIYHPRQYFLRMLVFLRYYRPNQLLQRSPSSGDIRAFLRSMCRVGLRPRTTLWYWASLLVSLIMNPKAFPSVIRLWVLHGDFERLAGQAAR